MVTNNSLRLEVLCDNLLITSRRFLHRKYLIYEVTHYIYIERLHDKLFKTIQSPILGSQIYYLGEVIHNICIMNTELLFPQLISGSVVGSCSS